MKRVVALILSLALIFSLAACDNGSTPDPPDGDNSGGSHHGQSTLGVKKTSLGADSADCDMLEFFGLSEAIPKNYTDVDCISEILSANSVDYLFIVPVKGDAGIERRDYSNQLLAAIKAASDDGKAYKSDLVLNEATGLLEPGYVEATDYEDALDDYQMPSFYFSRDGEVLFIVTTDYVNDNNHHYEILISPDSVASNLFS